MLLADLPIIRELLRSTYAKTKKSGRRYWLATIVAARYTGTDSNNSVSRARLHVTAAKK
jgi:hypothetical protein